MSLYQDLQQAPLNIRRNEFDQNDQKFLTSAASATKHPDFLIDFRRDKFGGPLSYYLNRAEPLRLRSKWENVFTACWVKRILNVFLKDFQSKNWFQKGLVLLSVGLYYDIWIKYAHYGVRERMPDFSKLSQPIKELYRVMTGVFSDEERDILCFISEYDQAYKYREQDALPELDKHKLIQNPRKEVLRLLDVLVSRERASEGMRNKWRFMKLLLNIYLRFNKKLLNKIKKTLLEINLEEVKLSKEDIYWSNQYDDYNFRGLTNEERIADQRIRYGDDQTNYDLMMRDG